MTSLQSSPRYYRKTLLHPFTIVLNMPSNDHPLNNLHNLVGGLRRTYNLEQHPRGPSHCVNWEVIVYVDGVEYGRATNRQLQKAKSDAARRALDELRAEYGV